MNTSRFQILLVEDNPGDARLIRAVLDEAGGGRFEVRHAQTLREALALLAASAPDVVLLDLNLPDEQGVETVARVNGAAPRIPIVVLTGTTDEALALRAMEHGAQEYLVKGRVEGAHLVRALRHAVVRKRAVESARRLALEQAARAEAERVAAQLQTHTALLGALTHETEPARALAPLAAAVGGACAVDVDTPDGRRVRWAESDAASALLASVPPSALRPLPPEGALLEDAIAAVPLSFQGRPLGAVLIASPGGVGARELQLLGGLAPLISLWVERARLQAGGTFSA